MLSSRINTDDDGDDDGNEDDSIMPGDYEPWQGAAARMTPVRTVPPRRPVIPPMPRPSRRVPTIPPTTAPKKRTSVTPATSPVRHRRSRRRSITPEIVIERHHHRHHLSSGRHRVITIPLDNRPTLGLRGPPKRMLEIERVRCRRRRKHRSPRYEIDYDDPLPSPLQPQSNVIVANPLPNPCLSPVQPSLMASANNSAASLALLSNLTPEMIENLPKQTVHLPPIYLPGSQADANTELHTVIFPAEIINPINRTLSIIQPHPTTNGRQTANIQSPVFVSPQSQFINAPTNVESPLAALSMASGPFMQQVQDLFQRITLSQPQPTSSPFNHVPIQPSFPTMTHYNAANNSLYNQQTILPINTTNTGPYPSANIRPVTIPNSGSYNPTTFTLSNPGNITPYRPANITPYQSVSATPYNPANITPYTPANITPYQSVSAASNSPPNTTSYRPANITHYQPASTTSYSRANTTPYQSTNSTPSNLTNIRSYYPTSIAPSNTSDIQPYRPANITPYSTLPNRSGDSSMFSPSIPSASIPYKSSSSFASSDSFSSSPTGIDNRPLNIPYSSQMPYQSNTSMPKSILRNAPSNTLLNTTYTRLNPASVSSSNSIVRKTATYT